MSNKKTQMNTCLSMYAKYRKLRQKMLMSPSIDEGGEVDELKFLFGVGAITSAEFRQSALSLMGKNNTTNADVGYLFRQADIVGLCW